MEWKPTRKEVSENFTQRKIFQIWIGQSTWKSELAHLYFKGLGLCDLHSHLTSMISISVILGQQPLAYLLSCEYYVWSPTLWLEIDIFFHNAWGREKYFYWPCSFIYWIQTHFSAFLHILPNEIANINRRAWYSLNMFYVKQLIMIDWYRCIMYHVIDTIRKKFSILIIPVTNLRITFSQWLWPHKYPTL